MPTAYYFDDGFPVDYGSKHYDPHREAYDPDRAPYGRPLPVANLMPTLPGMTALSGSLKTYAPSPVWKDSTTDTVKFQPLPKRQAVKIYHDARRFDRTTHQPGQHGGAVGHTALQVLHALLFDFLNYASGRLEPSYEAIARKANVCRASVGRALVRLKGLGMLNWLRRCSATMQDGRFMLEQETNAYAVLPPSQWRGYRVPEPPAPEAGTWGDHPPLPDAVTMAAVVRAQGGSPAAQIHALESDPNDPNARVLASIGRAIQERDVREAQAGLAAVRARMDAAFAAQNT